MRKHRNIKHKPDSFAGRMLLTVLAGILLVSVSVSWVVLCMSQRVFMETYGKSQEKVFGQIEEDLNDFHGNLQNIIDAIDTSWAFRLYLGEESGLDNVRTFQNIYQMERDLEQSKASHMERLNILVLGKNGKHYLSRTETLSMSDEDIWKSQAVQQAVKEPETIHYLYSEGAYTETARASQVLIASKALYYQESKSIYGVVLITLTMEDMREYYDYFVTENTSLYLIDGNGVTACSNERGTLGKVMEEKWYQEACRTPEAILQVKDRGRNLTIMQRELSYLGYTMYGVIDNHLALSRLYNMPLLVLLCAGIGGLTLFACLFFTRQTMRPLSELVQKMEGIREGDFERYMPVNGTMKAPAEIRELTATYNYMLDGIKTYIRQLLKTQKEKRRSEIKALQMQINPHYIYNTLASIKWLVYSKDSEKTIQTIDAFIALLRNTISNTEEFITVEQELVNLENYILINYTRYGEAVKVEYYVSQSCRGCLLPKMILQPFIENAFFHAFPSGQEGSIQIFMKEREGILEIQIKDDGIGMDKTEADRAVKEEGHREHFSGIGIHNVQERLKLLYGEAYGVSIFSGQGKGTTVVLRLPAVKGDGEKDEA